MLATNIIAKKRDAGELTREEIQFMVEGLVKGSIADYQVSAWAMAVLCRGMSVDETAALTDAMLASGGRLARASDRPRVDKHSTGGLGDKVSLILAPLLACCEVDVPMLSGRGLGITGGTLDKLEAYSGYNCHLSKPQIDEQLRQIGCVITGTTDDIAPADRKLYALRDVTGTVPSIALITASIMSKKLAASLDALVLDVKFGSAAFMRDLGSARALGASLRRTGERMQVPTRAILSDMNQPLGRMVGNACEANEAVQVLRGGGPTDVRQLTLRLAGELLVSIGRSRHLAEAEEELARLLDNGLGLERYIRMIVSQGGQFREQLPLSATHELCSPSAGWLASLDGQSLGEVIIGLGGGRRQLGDRIDHSVGLEMLVRIGDRVEVGQRLARIFARTRSDAEQATRQVLQSMNFVEQPAEPLSLIVD